MSSGDLRADVAVIGAGPAGSMAALALARAGLDVALVDREAFPRAKTCGDGLMPDAMAALRSVGLAEGVLADARRHDTLRIYSPNGTSAAISGEFAVLPRERLDARLCEAAVEAGARLFAPVHVIGPLEEAGRVTGVVARTSPSTSLAIHAPATVLATGAGAGPLKAFGVCERSQPSATAARFYATLEGRHDSVDPGCLCISYDRSICPGYGWVFPGPAGSFNIGVGYFYDARTQPAVVNLRLQMERFLDTFRPARAIAQACGNSFTLRGAPLRTGLTGSSLSRPGLLVVGDAAGLTYSISGEGIGKAMESGLLAAEVIAEHLARGSGPKHAAPVRIAEEYASRLRARFERRFEQYSSAQRWVAHPHLVDFLAWRTVRGTYVRQQIEGLVNETTDPRAILSLWGIVRSVFG